MTKEKKNKSKITVVVVTEQGAYTFHQVKTVIVVDDKKLKLQLASGPQ